MFKQRSYNKVYLELKILIVSKAVNMSKYPKNQSITSSFSQIQFKNKTLTKQMS